MRRSAFGAVLFTTLTLGALGAAGYGIYQWGFTQGALETGATVVAPAAGYAPGFFAIGIFGLFFKILFLFLIIGLIARLIFGRRRWHGGPWSHAGYGHPGMGWHEGPWAKGAGEGAGGNPMEQRLVEWHERAHGRGAKDGTEPEAGTDR